MVRACPADGFTHFKAVLHHILRKYSMLFVVVTQRLNSDSSPQRGGLAGVRQPRTRSLGGPRPSWMQTKPNDTRLLRKGAGKHQCAGWLWPGDVSPALSTRGGRRGRHASAGRLRRASYLLRMLPNGDQRPRELQK